MNEETENKIIELYLSGIGSTTIIRLLPNLTKRKVLDCLNRKNLLRNRHFSDEFYSNFWFENGKWWGYWKCKMCNEDIKFSVNKKCLLHRNLKRKNICKECSSKKQIGNGNPFYNKKHTKLTIDKISKTKTGVSTSNHMSRPEYRKMFSVKAKERWANGSMEKVRVKMSELMKQRIANGELSSYNRSKAEDEIIKILTNNGINVIPNFKIGSKIFDIFIPKYNLLIEYNGDYWHCNPKKYSPDYFNKKKSMLAKEIWKYDNNKLYLAKNSNYHCEVIWEMDYKKDNNTILNLIEKYERK